MTAGGVVAILGRKWSCSAEDDDWVHQSCVAASVQFLNPWTASA